MAAIATALLAAGCSAARKPGPAIQLDSAQVTLPNASGVTNAYVDVQNNGPADQIIGARLSAGGRILLRSPERAGLTVMRTVHSIQIPAHSFVGLDPNSSHLLVIDAGQMKAGTVITLTLVFAHAGAISAAAIVTNPQTGGSSYFLN